MHTMVNMKRLWIFLLGCMISASAAHADIFKYVDEHGVICYTDTPKGKKADKVYSDPVDKTPLPHQSARSTSRVADYHDIVHVKASQYDLDPLLVKAVITTESNWNERAVSRKGAMGLMQLMPATAMEMNVRDPYNPEENIEGGVKYLRYLLERFDGDLTLALAAYNAGPSAVEKFGNVPPISETKQYVHKVLSLYNGSAALQSSAHEPIPKKKKYEPIYKVFQEDGSVLFTNSSLYSKNIVRF